MLTENYCDKDTAFALQELGYDPYMFYDDGTPAIHLWYAQKFLREEYNFHLEITYSPSCWTGKIYDLKEWDYIKGFTFFESFEETLHTLIKEAVKILKEK